jgi:hypothetical protein
MMRLATATFLLVLACAAPAAAQTIGIAPVKPCYQPGDEITATGAGFTAGGAVDIQINGTSLGQIAADGAGAFGVPITLGVMRKGKGYALTAIDQTNPALQATTSYLGAATEVSVSPQKAPAGTKRTIKGWGFVGGPKVYMHVRGPGGYKSDKKIANAGGPCGTFAVRKRMTSSSVQDGKYKVQFDHKAKYSKKTRPRAGGVLTID